MPELDFERTLDSITVGIRHRKDLGDIDELADSIRSIGMLHPITITPDGVLVCGRRRLEAVRRLGWRTIKIWVRSGISDRLTELLAQRDENALRKELNQVEQAELYAELKTLWEEDGRRRQEATRFGADDAPAEMNGAAHCTAPQPARGEGDSRRLASRAITGGDSFNRLERINLIKAIAQDRFQPAAVRELAATQLAAVEAGGPVEPSYRRVRLAVDQARQPVDSAEDSSAQVTERAKKQQTRRGLRLVDADSASADDRPRYRSLRAFILTWTELEGWAKRYDLDQLARDLSDEEFDRFDRVVKESIDFRDRLTLARSEPISPRTSRA